jgi:hypothetical protein
MAPTVPVPQHWSSIKGTIQTDKNFLKGYRIGIASGTVITCHMGRVKISV